MRPIFAGRGVRFDAGGGRGDVPMVHARRRGVFSALASATLHAALVGVFLIDPSDETSFQPIVSSRGAVQVSLISGSAISEGDPGQTSELFEDLSSQRSAPTSATPSDPVRGSLSELWGPRSAALPAVSPAGSAAVATLASGDPRALVSMPRRGGSGVGSCWRRTTKPVPVVATIVVDEDGVVLGRPSLSTKRGDAAAEAAVKAEVMRAMSGCAPYSIATRPGRYRKLELDFSRETNWVREAGFVEVR